MPSQTELDGYANGRTCLLQPYSTSRRCDGCREGMLVHGCWSPRALRVVSPRLLQPDHPDPKSSNLRLLARVLEAFVAHPTRYGGGACTWGVFLECVRDSNPRPGSQSIRARLKPVLTASARFTKRMLMAREPPTRLPSSVARSASCRISTATRVPSFSRSHGCLRPIHLASSSPRGSRPTPPTTTDVGGASANHPWAIW